jgi:hypothetical protein
MKFFLFFSLFVVETRGTRTEKVMCDQLELKNSTERGFFSNKRMAKKYERRNKNIKGKRLGKREKK